jgi:hypothetical protein
VFQVLHTGTSSNDISLSGTIIDADLRQVNVDAFNAVGRFQHGTVVLFVTIAASVFLTSVIRDFITKNVSIIPADNVVIRSIYLSAILFTSLVISAVVQAVAMERTNTLPNKLQDFTRDY